MSIAKMQLCKLFFVLAFAVKHLVFPLVRLRLGEVNCLSNLNFHNYNNDRKRPNCKLFFLQHDFYVVMC